MFLRFLMQLYHLHNLLILDKLHILEYMFDVCVYMCICYIFDLLYQETCALEILLFIMLVEGHLLVEWLFLAKCITLLKYCVNK